MDITLNKVYSLHDVLFKSIETRGLRYGKRFDFVKPVIANFFVENQ